MIELIFLIFMIVAFWRLYAKAGEHGWASIVPVYSFAVLFRMSGLSPWLVLTIFLPPVFSVILIISMAKLSYKFGKKAGFALGLIFLSFIFVPILAFGSSKYTG